ncbi:TPA: hypothetical protein IAA68_02055 [Candidatus Galligastranaerophilus faecipullorum]|nr:hypothetical protein [Candidatus Galligastranaerophilus faecipullorum]
MTQQYNTSNIKIKTAVLIFLKNLSAPLVLYFDNPQEVYGELREVVNTPVNKVFEFEPNGPIKKVCIQASQISGVALQEEQYFA